MKPRLASAHLSAREIATVAALVAILTLSGCRSLGPGATARLATIIFTQATSEEMPLSGLAGPVVPIAGIAINSPDAETGELLTELFGGVVIGKSFALTVAEEALPWQVLCQGGTAKVCDELKLNAVVTVWGKPAGSGRLFIATRVNVQR